MSGQPGLEPVEHQVEPVGELVPVGVVVPDHQLLDHLGEVGVLLGERRRERSKEVLRALTRLEGQVTRANVLSRAVDLLDAS